MPCGILKYDGLLFSIIFQYERHLGKKIAALLGGVFYRFTMRFRRSLWALRRPNSLRIALATMQATSVTTMPPHKPTSRDCATISPNAIFCFLSFKRIARRRLPPGFFSLVIGCFFPGAAPCLCPVRISRTTWQFAYRLFRSRLFCFPWPCGLSRKPL